MAATPSGRGIPWHRVVGERGKILIRGPVAMLQKKLLESEGVEVIESRVQLKAHLWNRTKSKHHARKNVHERVFLLGSFGHRARKNEFCSCAITLADDCFHFAG